MAARSRRITRMTPTQGVRCYNSGIKTTPLATRLFSYVTWLFLNSLIVTLQLLTTGSSYAAGAAASPNDIHIVVILPQDKHPYSIRNVLPGIQLALGKVAELKYAPSKPLLPLHNLVVHYKDSKCSNAIGGRHAIEMVYVNKTANVFMGPGCDFVTSYISIQTEYWNIPLITPRAFPSYFTNKTNSGLLTRMLMTYDKLGGFLSTVVEHFGWNIVSIIYDTDGERPEGECKFMMESLHKVLLVNNPGKDIWHKNFDERQETYLKDIEKRLKEASEESRIIFLCATTPQTIRKAMLIASDLQYTNGEYVFITVNLFGTKSELEYFWRDETDTEENNQKAMKALESLLMVTIHKPTHSEYIEFTEKVKAEMRRTYGDTEDEVSPYVGAFYDSVMLYAYALNATLEAGYDASNGVEVTRRMREREFTGITGKVSIDRNGDRDSDFSLLDLNPYTSKFEVVANYYGGSKSYVPAAGATIDWGNGRLSVPPDVPPCGFDGALCPNNFPEYAIVILVLGILLILVLVVALATYRHVKFEAELAEINWRVRWDDIMFGVTEKRKLERSSSRLSLARHSHASAASLDTYVAKDRQIYIKTGYYRATLVAIKKINRTNININRKRLLEFKTMRDIQNDHVVRFIGICIDPPNQCILTEYCQKGSLQDVLEKDEINLDRMFKFSLMHDIIRGMAYLHSTEIKSHGNLKSSNCVVDNRFVLKITDFGLPSLRTPDVDPAEDVYAFYRGKLWTSPELLRMINPPREGSQKGDVYSFAVICQEIICRNGPFWVENMDLSPREIYQKVKNGQQPYFRPTLDQSDQDDCCSEELASVVQKCWAEDPTERPDFGALKSIMRKINKEGDSGNLLDNLLRRMEMYANNLESLVEERTANYREQKKRAEDLLYMMLPKSVADQLMRGESVTAEKYEDVTIYFSDICGFTSLSAESTPMEVIALLNDLYTTFDSIIGTFDVYKVETIGDAYMVVSGLPIRNGTNHVREIGRMSLALLGAVKSFRIRHKPQEILKLRIGIHTGPVCAGVVGHKMPRYCLFGDTVNTASRMESNGEELRIHVSPQTKELLDAFGTFQLELRGAINVKGKGIIVTWWLTGEYNQDHPDFISDNTSL